MEETRKELGHCESCGAGLPPKEKHDNQCTKFCTGKCDCYIKNEQFIQEGEELAMIESGLI